MKKSLFILLAFALLLMLLLPLCFAGEIAPYTINCAEHGNLEETEIATLIIMGSENYICLHCVMELWKNNQSEINKIIRKAKEIQ